MSFINLLAHGERIFVLFFGRKLIGSDANYLFVNVVQPSNTKQRERNKKKLLMGIWFWFASLIDKQKFLYMSNDHQNLYEYLMGLHFESKLPIKTQFFMDCDKHFWSKDWTNFPKILLKLFLTCPKGTKKLIFIDSTITFLLLDGAEP